MSEQAKLHAERLANAVMYAALLEQQRDEARADARRYRDENLRLTVRLTNVPQT